MPGYKTNKPRFRNPADKAAQASAMLLERVGGATIAKIAAKFNCSEPTVANYLDYARKHSTVVQEATKAIGLSLVPLALATYEKRLHEGDLDAARDILFGMGILQKTAKIEHQPAASEDLESFRAAFFSSRPVVDVTPTSQKALKPLETTQPLTQATPLSSEVLVPGGSLASPEGILSDILDEPVFRTPASYADLPNRDNEDREDD